MYCDRSSSHSCLFTPQTPILSAFPSLTLEWNSLGLWEEGFSFFCQGLRANNVLHRLDLRNNQINHQGAGELAMALTHNTSLQELGKSSLPTHTYIYIFTCKHTCIFMFLASVCSSWSVSFLILVNLKCFAGFVQGEVTTPWPLESGN